MVKIKKGQCVCRSLKQIEGIFKNFKNNCSKSNANHKIAHQNKKSLLDYYDI